MSDGRTPKKASLNGFVQSIRRTKRRPAGHKRVNSGQKRTVAYYTGAIKASGEGAKTAAMFKSHCPKTLLTKRHIIYTWRSLSGTQNIRRTNLFTLIHSVRGLSRTADTVVSVAAASPRPSRVTTSRKSPVVTWSSGFFDPFSDSASPVNCFSVFGIELNCCASESAEQVAKSTRRVTTTRYIASSYSGRCHQFAVGRFGRL